MARPPFLGCAETTIYDLANSPQVHKDLANFQKIFGERKMPEQRTGCPVCFGVGCTSCNGTGTMADQPEYTVQGLLQAIDEYQAINPWSRHLGIPDHAITAAEWMKTRARALTSATPAPDAAGDAEHLANYVEQFAHIGLRDSLPEIAEALRGAAVLRGKLIALIDALPDTRKLLIAREDALAALANPPPSAPALRTGIQNIGAGDGVEGEGVK